MAHKRLVLAALSTFFISSASAQKFLDQFEIPKGSPVKIIETFSMQKGEEKKEMLTTTFNYEDGHISSKQVEYPDPSKNKTIEYIFSGGIPMDIIEKDASGEWVTKTYVNIDYASNISGFKKMDKQYQTLKHEGYKYDDDRMVKYIVFDKDGQPEAVTTFEYNAYGLLVRKSTMRDGMESSFVEYTLNGKGQIAEEKLVHHEFSYLSYVFKFSYNEQGDMVTTEMNTGDVNYIAYEYDEKGNWISKTSWFKNSPDNKTIYTRQITY